LTPIAQLKSVKNPSTELVGTSKLLTNNDKDSGIFRKYNSERKVVKI